MLPVDVLQVVLLLLQFEDMADEELLQVLVGKVDAQLLKATQAERMFHRHFKRHDLEKSFTPPKKQKSVSSPVYDKILKAEDVQQSDRPSYNTALARRRSENGCVNFVYYPDKQPAVDPLDDKEQCQNTNSQNHLLITA